MPMVCGSCRTVFPAASEYDHFARFGIERRFEIDAADLERRYLVLSRGLHPDQFAGQSAKDRALSEQLSAHVNDAFHVLKAPLRRAEYLLELEGGPLRAQEKRTPKGFLAEMLEINERIEEARDGGPEGLASLEPLLADLVARRTALVAEMKPLFDSMPPGSDPKRLPVLVAIREKLNACAYLQGLITQIRELRLEGL